MLSQLVYVSKRHSYCTDAEIEKILEACKKNNPPLNITGVLLYSDSMFVQLVEGESKKIVSLYDKIKADPRHNNVRMIGYGPIKDKSFPGWHMGARKFSNADVDFKTDISPDDRKVFNGLLNGKEEDGQRVLGLLMKFF